MPAFSFGPSDRTDGGSSRATPAPDARSSASAASTAPSPARRASAAGRTPTRRRARNGRRPGCRAGARRAGTRRPSRNSSSSAALTRARVDAHRDDADRELALAHRLVLVDRREEVLRSPPCRTPTASAAPASRRRADRVAQIVAVQAGRRVDDEPLRAGVLHVARFAAGGAATMRGKSAGRRAAIPSTSAADRDPAARHAAACPRASRRHWSRASSCRCRLSDWRRGSSASGPPRIRDSGKAAMLAPIPRARR